MIDIVHYDGRRAPPARWSRLRESCCMVKIVRATAQQAFVVSKTLFSPNCRVKSEGELAGLQGADLAAGDVTGGGIGAASGGQLRSHREPPPAQAVQEDPDLVRRPKARLFVSTQR